MKISIGNTAVLVIDMQEKLLPVINDNEKILNKTRKLLDVAKIFGLPVLVTEQYPKGLGETVHTIKEMGYPIVEKTTFSACHEDKVLEWLRKQRKEYVLVCGVEAHICVLQTAVDLPKAGSKSVIVRDCVGSRENEEKEAAIVRAFSEGAGVTTFEQAVYEMLRDSDNEYFKQVSEIVKR